jgi:cobalt-zinc-cadmium efflux system outer membrane protein
LKPNRKTRKFWNIYAGLLAWAVLGCVLTANPALGQTQGPIRITLDEAIQMALQHNHNILAARTTIEQSAAEEITANLRPNPVLFTDWEYLPLFGSPAHQNPDLYTGVSTPDYLKNNTEGDLGLSYLIERGGKRLDRLRDRKSVV